ncbi:ABC transporter ATP-binding protein [Seohaeicola saemankumensis]|nr:ABC transporter ATP-binding protein [Seohaeicola saemankumensis]MCA0873286.1 ABC transporter ATP-binding protein [Seohaeicola saemankumensis]
MLEVSDLTVRYGQHRALEQAAIRVSPGEIVVILGANGAGKSTLLKAISGICEGLVTGTVHLDGIDLSGMRPNRIVDEGIALVPEGRGVFGDLSVRENLVLGAYSDRARSEEAANLDRVYTLFPKLRERGPQIVRTMSGGEQQMVAIGRAMMSNPAFLTLDEPSLGLSPLLCKELFQNLAKVRDLGIGVLLVEQNAKQSLAIADRGYLLENAHIVHEDTANALRSDPAVQAAYLGAGGAAAPHTYDDITVTHPDLPPPDLPQGFTVTRRKARTVSADTLLGQSVADLVAGASKRSVPAPRSASPPQVSTDRIETVLRDIETAARNARNRTRTPERLDVPAPTPSANPVNPDKPEPPVTIEVYRAPRVEVYRRRPGGDDFERS